MSAIPAPPRSRASTGKTTNSRWTSTSAPSWSPPRPPSPNCAPAAAARLLYTASTSGLTGSQFSPVYNIAKFGVVGLVHGLSKRYAREKIRVNAVCPGPTDTPMLRVFVARPDSQLPPGETPESLVQKRGGQVPMGRPAQPEEIANAALFLISDEASYITGVALPVDGGATA